MKRQTFSSVLAKSSRPGGWTTIDIPFNVEEVFGSKGYVQVKGTIDGVSFDKTKLMPVGNGQYQMAVNEQTRKAIGKGHDDIVHVTMEADTAEALYTEDPAFLEALAAEPGAEAFYLSLTAAAKKWFIIDIAGAKQESTKLRRIEKAIGRLKAGKKFHD